jgi:hypothetical protein
VKSQHHLRRSIAVGVTQLRSVAAHTAAPGNRPRIGLFAKNGILQNGAWQGDTLDVFSLEPIGDDVVLRQLLSHERVIAAPHLGASKIETQMRVASEVTWNIISALCGDILSGVSTLPFPPAKLA